MAVTSTQKTVLKLTLSDGTTKNITLPAPINNTLTDEDSGDGIWIASYPKIKAAYQTDTGATVVQMTAQIVTTTTNAVVEDYSA